MSTNIDLGCATTGEYDVITDAEISQLPLEVQKSIEKGKNCKVADSINILVMGKAGSGKSTLVSGILGLKVHNSSDGRVNEYKMKRENITVRVWDSPGLQDGTGNQEDYLRQIEQQCSYRDLTIYCIRISDTRFVHTAENPDVVAMKKLTRAFGKSFWSSCIIALTYANTLTAMDLDWDTLSVAEQNRRFQGKISEWKEQVQDILVKDIGISRDMVKTITIAPVGHYRKPHLPGCDYWLSNFFFKCVVTISTPEVRRALVKINLSRFKREKEVKESDFGMSPEDQPIVATETTISILQVVAVGFAGGAIGSTVVGLISLVAGPAALLVSIPVGFIIGALIGGGATVAKIMRGQS